MSHNRIPIPAWKHMPHLGFLHYHSSVTSRALDTSDILYLPPLNPYLGFINHSVRATQTHLEPATREASTQTDRVPEYELGKQLMGKMRYK